MASSSIKDVDDLYEDVSDTELAALNLDGDDDDVPAVPSYAEAAARGVSPDRRTYHNDDESDTDEPRPRAPGASSFRNLADIERENFHPLNVTPDRPCTAYFKVGEDVTSKQIFDSFRITGIPALAIRCLQRKPTGEVLVTFSKSDYRDLFLQRSPLIGHRRYATHPDSDPLVYLTIYDAPHELPDSAIEHRLKPFCSVFSRRRGKLQGYPDTYNGRRHYRVRLYRSVPCYLRFGRFQLRFYHDRQQKTCRRCGSKDHLARECENSVCFNCDSIGHVSRECEEPTRCCICKSIEHMAIDCPLSWYRRPALSPRGSPSRDAETEEAPPPDLHPSTEGPAARDEVSPPVDVDLSEGNTQDDPTAQENTTSADAEMTASPDVAVSPPAPGALSSQGFILPQDPVLPTTHSGSLPSPAPESSVLEDLQLSEDELDDCASNVGDSDDGNTEENSTLDPTDSLLSVVSERLPLAAALIKPKAARKKIGRRNPAKLTATSQPPLRKATQPSIPTTRRSTSTPDLFDVSISPT